MNSISYLDSILTRSLTSSRSGSGTTTPNTRRSGDGSAKESSHGHLNRRASDYSLTREREREKRRVAASLGLTSLDAGESSLSYDRRRSSRKSSRKSSRSGSARQSESEQPADTERELAANIRRSRYSEGNTTDDASARRHPKSYSEGYDEEELRRQRLKRTGSTPAPVRPTAARGWGSLWGFGGFLEDAGAGRGGNVGGTGSYDGYMRRSLGASSSSVHAQNVGGTLALGHGRRASTGDADSALVGFAPHALLSEREREDVVDLEGYDPEDDLNPLPIAPPSTPFPGSMTPSSTTKDGEKYSVPSTPEEGGPTTASRLSALLFGALNPLTDDYFGPQAGATRLASRRRASEASEKKKRSGRTRRSSHASKDSVSEASSSGHGHEQTPTIVTDEKSAIKEAAEDKHTANATIPTDPPPPYTDDGQQKIGASTSSLLPPLPVVQSAHSDASKQVRKPSNKVLRGLKRTLELLRRLLLAIFLAPYRIIQYSRGANGRTLVEVQAVGGVAFPESGSDTVRSTSQTSARGKRFQSVSQAERPSAARHMARRRQSDDEEKEPLLGGVKASDSDSEVEEVVTEEQAEARAIRRARKDALRAQESKTFNEQDDKQQPRVSSRLLPNPNPVDPLLAHDRKSHQTDSPTFDGREQKLQRQRQLRERQAVVARGPLSSLIHHSPKVLVLDLDETLIHSTSRSPTWSALADKSKSRLAVTTGGSLLGLEGLGGVLGLRGQVGVRPHQVEVVLDGRSIIYHVYKRPHVDTFLRKVAQWYHVVVFTASVQEYADPVIDWLDQGRGLISARLFRESCTYRNGSYSKNLSLVDVDLSRICLVDNSPASYAINQANGIPIEGWTHDPNDEALLDLLPVLDSLRFASDVRHILGIRGFSDPSSKQLPAISA